jgi:phosphatidylglycerophosphatase A
MFEKYDPSSPANKVEMTSRFVWADPAHIIAAFFGAGLPKKAPGTFGTLAGAISYIVLAPSIGVFGMGIIALIFLIFGAWAAQKTGEDIGVHDHKGIVIDEVVAIWLLYLFIPSGILWWAAGFIAFRFFDIVKLPPCNLIDEKCKNGAGVMADDLVAALYAWILIRVLAWIFG